MRQWKVMRQIFFKRSDGFGQGGFTILAQIQFLRITADQQCQLHLRHCRQQSRMPGRRAFGARRQVAVLALARITECGRHDRYPCCVVKDFARQVQPCAQPVARRIVPWNPGVMHATAGRLPDDQQARACPRLHHRPGRMRQVFFAQAAGADFRQQRQQLFVIHACAVP